MRIAETKTAVAEEMESDMRTYWIVRENGNIVAAMAEDLEINDPHQFINDIKEFAELGPVERIRTHEPIHLGGTVDKFVRPKS